MAIELPENTERVEARMKADVSRSAPDSNPYIAGHWLRSLIAGFARRIFDFYGDLRRTELRLFPDTADDETAPIWGSIYVGAKNQETISSGSITVTGAAGSMIGVGVTLTSGGRDYITTTNGTVSEQAINVVQLTRTGTTATVTTLNSHKLSSFVKVDISGAIETEFNIDGAEILVTGADSFEYQIISGTPTTPATGAILAKFILASVDVDSNDFGDASNLTLDTPIKFQTPAPGVDDIAYVDFGTISGGTDAESTED